MTIPQHLGIILDGNRRWAKERGLGMFEGHKKGLKRIKKIVNYCKEKGVKILTLFVFSTENWQRPKKEVGFLMQLAKRALKNDFKEYQNKGIRVKIIGQKEKLPRDLQREIFSIEKSTEKNKGMILNMALSYGGRAEIVQALRRILAKKINPEKITEEIIKENLWTSDVDLIIRTGKEQRISNFLIWQAAYSEFYFCPKYWPDFKEDDLDKAFLEYSRRKRRFGK